MVGYTWGFVLAIMGMLVLFWISWYKKLMFFCTRESSSSFECGFDSKKVSRLPFSLRFFFLLVLFLMFDMELVLFLKLPFVTKLYFSKGILLEFTGLVVVLGGLLEEWRRGVLFWKS